MELSDKANAVSRMQKYMLSRLDEKITLDCLAAAAGALVYPSSN